MMNPKLQRFVTHVLTPITLAFGVAGCGPQSGQQPQGGGRDPYDIGWAKGDEPVDGDIPFDERTPTNEMSASTDTSTPPAADGAAINTAVRRDVVAFMRANGSWDETQCFRFLSAYAEGRDADKNANCPREGFYESFSIVNNGNVTGAVFRINGDMPRSWYNAPPEISLHARRFLASMHELGHHLCAMAGIRYSQDEHELAADLFALSMLRKYHPRDAEAVETWYRQMIDGAMAATPFDEHGLLLTVDLNRFHAATDGGARDVLSVFQRSTRFMTELGYNPARSTTRYSARMPQ